MNVSEDNVEEVSQMLVVASSQSDLITESGLENMISSLDSIVRVESPSTEVRNQRC